MGAIRKIEERFIQQTPLEMCLAIWVNWTKRDNVSNTHRERICDHDEDDTPYIIADIKTAEAVDMLVHSLPRHHQWAVRKSCGISPAVWQYPHLDYLDTLAEAELVLNQKMKKNFACCKYFD